MNHRIVSSPLGACALLAVAEADDLVTADTAAALGLTVLTLDQAAGQMLPEELAAAAGYGPIRHRDWVAGRAAAGRLLGPGRGPVLSEASGLPIFPPGWVGSISHKRGVAAAVAQPSREFALGVDIELASPFPSRRAAIASRILTPAELERWQADSGGDPAALMRSFSVKEAIYKAIFPQVRRYVGFREVEVEFVDGESCVVSWPGGVEPALRIEAWSTTLGPLIVSVVRSAAHQGGQGWSFEVGPGPDSRR